MEHTETCVICGRLDVPSNLSVWFVKSERRTVHVDCWIAAASDKDRDDGESTERELPNSR